VLASPAVPMPRFLILLVAALLAAAALTAAVAAGADDPRARAAVKTVNLRDDLFQPRGLSARRSEIVRFVWMGRNTHNVRGYRGQKFNSGSRGKTSGSFRIRVKARRGTRIRFICDFHPTTMRGTIRVR
jgi:plastocyanin